ncbi:transmembrane protease serine 2 [Xenopus laevis]|nr:transmembrane protease serine 2 [Xenopus laevis]
MAGRDYRWKSPSPPYFENYGFQQDNNNAFSRPVQPNFYEAFQPPRPQLSPAPHYIPQVSTIHSVPAINEHKSQTWWTPRRKKIACIVAATSVLIALLIVGAVLCWYFVTMSCQMKCGTSGSCVRSIQWCDGVAQCPGGEDESYCVRMYGPDFQLQAYIPATSSWLSVCNENWGDSQGRSVCQDMGYSTYVKSSSVSATSATEGYLKLNTSVVNGKLQSRIYKSSFCTSGVVTLRCIECGSSTKNVENRIVGGSQASLGDWPWQVSLQYNERHVCGGSIITSNYILTAAHCVEGAYSSPYAWTVYVGSISRSTAGIRYYVKSVIGHQKYDTKTKNNDVALMRLKISILFSSTVQPVCLPNAGMPWASGQSCWTSGWGATYEGGTSSNVLNAAMVPLIDADTCNRPAVYNGAVTSTMICAGYLRGGIDSCQGDSGGPLVTKTNSLWWLVGDTSWGTGCANVNKPGVYGNITEFLPWIFLQMQTYG